VKAEKKSDAVISYTNADIDLLAKLIEAEASGETMQAKIAVGALSLTVFRVRNGLLDQR
jgi:spore germination cell wall hydrolase CwlJ-like protein